MNNNIEFNNIIKDIYESDEFNKLRSIPHHGITRFEHSLRVSYYTYKVTKFFNLNYVDATRAALLHDFFTTEVENESSLNRLRHHPEIARRNAKKYFNINERQEDMIVKHMWPITKTPPKYIESWIVNIMDNVSAVIEKCNITHYNLKNAVSLFIILLISSI